MATKPTGASIGYNFGGPKHRNLKAFWGLTENAGGTIDNLQGDIDLDGSLTLGNDATWGSDAEGLYYNPDSFGSNPITLNNTYNYKFNLSKGSFIFRYKYFGGTTNILRRLSKNTSGSIFIAHESEYLLAKFYLNNTLVELTSNSTISYDDHTVVITWGGTDGPLMWIDGVLQNSRITDAALWNTASADGSTPADVNLIMPAGDPSFFLLGQYGQDSYLRFFGLYNDVLDANDVKFLEEDPYLPMRLNSYWRTSAPMVSRCTKTSVQLSMTTSESFFGDIQFRVRYSTHRNSVYDSLTYSPTITVSGTSSRGVLTLSGLSSGTTYYYIPEWKLTSDSTWTEIGTISKFTTSRAKGSTYSCGIWTDTHISRTVLDNAFLDSAAAWKNEQVWNRVSDVCDFCVSLGDELSFPVNDFIYNQTDSDGWSADWREYARPILDAMPFYQCIGNHEGEETAQQDIGGIFLQKFRTISRKRFLLNPDDGENEDNSTWIGSATGDAVSGQAQGNTSPLENYFTWTWGDAQFWVLDVFRYTPATPNDATRWTLGPEQNTWLDNSLRSSSARWKIVMAHHMVGGKDAYGRGGIKNVLASGTEQISLHAKLVEHGVHAFLYGHDHVFHHGVLDGVNYVQCGSPSAFIGTVPIDSTYGGDFEDSYNGTYTSEDVKLIDRCFGYVRLEVSPTSLKIHCEETAWNLPRLDEGSGNWSKTKYDSQSLSPERDFSNSDSSIIQRGRSTPVIDSENIQLTLTPTDVDSVWTTRPAYESEQVAWETHYYNDGQVSGNAAFNYRPFTNEQNIHAGDFSSNVVTLSNALPGGTSEVWVDAIPNIFYTHTLTYSPVAPNTTNVSQLDFTNILHGMPPENAPPLDVRAKFRDDFSSLTIPLESNHSSTTWQFFREFDAEPHFTIKTTSGGVEGVIGNVLLSSLNSLSLALDRTIVWYVRYRVNDGEWSSKSLIRQKHRAPTGKHRDTHVIKKTKRGATVSTTNPLWTEQKTKRGSIIVNKTYVN